MVNIEEIKANVNVSQAFRDFLEFTGIEYDAISKEAQIMILKFFAGGYGLAINNIAPLTSNTEITNKEFELIIAHMGDTVVSTLKLLKHAEQNKQKEE